MCIIVTIVLIFVTYLFGFLYAITGGGIRCRLIAIFGWTGFSVSGFIGVPFHELSHLITALLFGHDVIDFSLYRPIKGRKDGMLGYVNHTYNPNSLYQKIGNFFIGSAPMTFGAILLTVLYNITSGISFADTSIFEFVTNSVLAFFEKLLEGNVFAILMLLTALFICPHICMSGADFKNMFAGTFSLIVASIIIPPYICYYTGITDYTLMLTVSGFAVLYTISLSIGFIIDLIVWLLLFLISIISKKST